MSKPYTEFDLSNQLTQDRTWRIREISDLRSITQRADTIQQRVLLRSLVTMCYAHWEGYIRFSARKFLEHIALRKLRYAELDRQYFRNYFLPRLAAMSSNKGSLEDRCTLIDNILDSSDRKFTQANNDLVNTQSNLNFDVFGDICLICGVSIENYAAKQAFIDVFLLKRRNSIAHGEDTLISIEDLMKLVDESIELMRTFGDELENRAVLKTYKLQAA